MKVDIKNMPPVAKGIIAVLPAIVLLAVVVISIVMPKQKEIKTLDAKIDEQNNKIAVSQAKAARLDVLVKENEKLLRRLGELKEYLPEEKEISSLLKEVSDRALDSGLVMQSWKPGQKTVHSSGIVYEIPVSVSVSGTYHDLGRFLSGLTKLNRIVNIGNTQIGSPRNVKGRAVLAISFTASTFSAIPEAELGKAEAGKKKK
jgi:type IV pilus assembly protein PilO